MSERDSSVEYRPVPGFEGYEVGCDGSVWSFWKHAGRHRRTLSDVPKIKKAVKQSNGYMRVGLHRDGKFFLRSVHRLVLEAFCGPQPEGRYQACHGDGDRANNVLGNLRWGTIEDNQSDKERHGKVYLGEDHPLSRMTEEQVRIVRAKLKAGVCVKEIASFLGVTYVMVRDIQRGRTWRHVK